MTRTDARQIGGTVGLVMFLGISCIALAILCVELAKVLT